MIALDTNVLARFLLKDDPAQHAAAVRLLSGPRDCTAPPTVLLELSWVLKVYGCTSAEIAKGLRLLLGLPHFKPIEPDALAYALRWFEAGMDFGDALHLALSAGHDRFMTFDKAFDKLAGELGAFPPVSRPQ